MATPAKTPFDYFTTSNTAFKDSLEKSMAAMAEINAHSKKNLEEIGRAHV